MKDLQSLSHGALAMAPNDGTADIAATVKVIDLKGFLGNSVDVFGVHTPTAVNYLTFQLFHGDASDLSDAVAVPADDVVVNGTVGGAAADGKFTWDEQATATSQLDATRSLTCRFGYRGSKRYIGLAYTEAGIVSVAASALFATFTGFLENAPYGSPA